MQSIFSNHKGIKLEIDSRRKRKTGKFTNIWKLNKTFLNNQWITEEIKVEIKNTKRQMKMKMMIPKLWDAAKAILIEKFIAIQAYLRKQEKSQINNLTLHLKQLEKEEQTNKQKTQSRS